jgi:hypothetical protein
MVIMKFPLAMIRSRHSGAGRNPDTWTNWAPAFAGETAKSIAPHELAEKPTKSLGFSIPRLEIFVQCISD